MKVKQHRKQFCRQNCFLCCFRPSTCDNFFIKRYNDENGFNVDGIEDGCLKILQAHNWPGNIRELENSVERAVVLTRTGKVKPEQFLFQTASEKSLQKADGLEVGMTVASELYRARTGAMFSRENHLPPGVKISRAISS